MNYLIWHYGKGLLGYFRVWGNFLEFFWFYFLAGQLLRTFFSPWKRDFSGYGRGFDLKRWIEAFFFNLASRLIGALVRLFFISLAVLFEAAVLFFGLALLFFWLTFIVSVPLLTVGGIYLLLAENILGAGFLLLGIALLNLGYFAFRNDGQKPYQEMTFEELARQKWFKRVWTHFGFKEAPSSFEKLKQKIREVDLNENDLGLIFRWESFLQTELERNKKFWQRESLLSCPPLTKNFAYGYTYHLDQYSSDLTQLYKKGLEPRILAHREEMEKMGAILAGSGESNVLLMGEPGSGKTSAVWGLAKTIARGQASPKIAFKRVLDLKLDEALAGLKDLAAMQERVNLLFFEAARAGNIILVIEEIERYVTTEEGVGKIDLSAALTTLLPYPTIQVIGTSNFSGYRKYLEPNRSLMKYFEKVEIEEPSFGEIFFVLCDTAWQLEKENGLTVSYQALKRIAGQSGRYFQESPQPQRALVLLRDLMIQAQKKNLKFVSAADVDELISEKTGIAVGALKKEEKEKLANLEEFLHRRVVNQEEAIKEISSAMRRRRLEIGDAKRPIGSFLFLGPTGVGKTETAKALAETYYGDEERMIRLDMTEYQEENDALEKLLGSPDGQTVGQLVSAVRERPFSLLLLDEIEKAGSRVVQLFLQVLEDGFLTDGLGRRVSFKETIIIATSNAGADLIRELVNDDPGLLNAKKAQVLDYVQDKGIFKPEFLNRFDSVVLFEPLNRENLFKIAGLMLKGLAKRLAEQRLLFEFGDDLIARVVDLGYDPQYGARPMRRVIQQKVEDLIAKKVLAGEIQKDAPFRIKGEEI